MNRIILIGNGFDLAHGSKTSYKDFLDDFWRGIIDEILESKKLVKSKEFENEYISLSGSTLYLRTFEFDESMPPFNSFLKFRKINSLNLTYKNKFIQLISQKESIQNWVDIENEYYALLKKNIANINNYGIIDLNKDFESVKTLLRKYLFDINEESERKAKMTIGKNIFAPIKLQDATETYLNQVVDRQLKTLSNNIEFQKGKTVNSLEEKREYKQFLENQRMESKSKAKENVRERLRSRNAPKLLDFIPKQLLFLNFNYTNFHSLYQNQSEFTNTPVEEIKVESNQIHGSIYQCHQKPIVFGFGDELDDDYLSIEKLNNNSYLENIKSIKYLETDNYKRLLSFINSGNYQIFLFGHSCGISDRTLLNTLFEHENCHSIKPFYHQISETEDNYSDIVRNISRNFKDKASMRNKVVNKEYCEPLT